MATLVDQNGVSCFTDQNGNTLFTDQNGNVLTCAPVVSRPYVSFRLSILLAVLAGAQIMARIGAGYG